MYRALHGIPDAATTDKNLHVVLDIYSRPIWVSGHSFITSALYCPFCESKPTIGKNQSAYHFVDRDREGTGRDCHTLVHTWHAARPCCSRLRHCEVFGRRRGKLWPGLVARRRIRRGGPERSPDNCFPSIRTFRDDAELFRLCVPNSRTISNGTRTLSETRAKSLCKIIVQNHCAYPVGPFRPDPFQCLKAFDPC